MAKNKDIKKNDKDVKKTEKSDVSPTFAECISKLIVSNDAPQGMLAEWEKNYDINAKIELKLKDNEAF